MKFLRQKSIIVLLLVASIILLTYSSIICVNAKPGRNTAINTANRIAKNDKGVTRIFNQHARIDDEGAILIAKALKNNEYLTHLDLRENEITDKGALALAEALEINRSLQWLDLNDNDIGDEGAKAFLNVIKDNRNLTRLHLTNNDKIHDDYAFAITYCLIHEDECNDLHTWSAEKLKDMAITYHRHTGEADHQDDFEDDGTRYRSHTSVWPEPKGDDVERDPHMHLEM